jgi:predicted phosphodiesterase
VSVLTDVSDAYSAPVERTGLKSARHIGLIGDIHGDVGALLTIAKTMGEREVTVLLALGDVGVPWPGENWSNRLSKIAKRLAALDQIFYFVDGNHDDHNLLQTFQTGADGARELRPNIFHLPRGYRTVLASGKSFAALGGANSIDFAHRKENVSWWPQEAIDDVDLQVLGTTHADIMVGHDAPLNVSTLDIQLARTDQRWSHRGLTYARQGRRTFHKGFLQASPSLYLGGHYHLPVDEVVGYFDGTRGFASRVVLLDMVQGEGWSSAILDTRTLQLEFFTTAGVPVPPSPAQVTELSVEMTGRWLVESDGSWHRFNLDDLTVERVPRPGAARLAAIDRVCRIRTLDAVRIGEPGRWSLLSESVPDYVWHVSSVIQHILPLSPGV